MKFNSKNLIKIINILKKNGIISLPTETVYGLAGNAYSYSAINKIFKIKKRLKKNPLIIHYYNLNHAKKDVLLDKNFYTQPVGLGRPPYFAIFFIGPDSKTS